MSVAECYMAPGLWSCLGAAWDVMAVVAPGVPGGFGAARKMVMGTQVVKAAQRVRPLKDRLISITNVAKRTLPNVDVEWHHLLPREFDDLYFKPAGLDIDKWTVPLTRETHKVLHGKGKLMDWNADWRAFFAGNRSATAEEITEQLQKMLNRYDLQGMVEDDIARLVKEAAEQSK